MPIFFLILGFLALVFMLGVGGTHLLRRRKLRLELLDQKLEELSEEDHAKDIYINEHKIFYQYFKGRKGRTFVLLHGIGASHYSWRRMVPLMKKDSNVLVVDLPGFGNSSKNPAYSHGVDDQAKVVNKLLAELEIEDPVLVGSSMGGTIVLWMSYIFPEKYQNLVLISPAVSPYRARLLHLPSIFVLTKLFGKSVLTRDFIKTLATRTVSQESLVTDEVVDAYYRPYKDDTDAMLCFIKAVEFLKDEKLWVHILGVRAKVLLLWGDRDQITPVRHLARFKKRFQSWVTAVHPTAGHHLQEDAPKWTIDQINRHLDLKGDS